MKNNEIGMAVIKLIFMMILIIIIILSATVLGKKLWKESNTKDLKTDLLYIQAKCKVIYDKHILNEEEKLIGEKISEYSENEEINNIISNGEWYKLNQENLKEIGAEHLKEKDGYIVNYETEEVIYASGIKEGENTFYKLSDIIKTKKESEENIEKTEKQENIDENTSSEQ